MMITSSLYYRSVVMRNNNGTIAKSDAMSVAKAGRVYIKNNNEKNRGGGIYCLSYGGL